MSKYGAPEIYTRFLREENIKENNSRIHWKAFKPDPNNESGRLEVSCYESQGLNKAQIKKIAEINNITPNNKFPHGHCSIREIDFPLKDINIEKNYIPERHIDIIGWEKYSSKEESKAISALLAEISSELIVIY
jgi:hypothetical protein